MWQSQQVAMAQSPEVVPFEATQVLLPRFGPMAFEQLLHPRNTCLFPSLSSQVHIRPIQKSAIGRPLLLGQTSLLFSDSSLLFGSQLLLFSALEVVFSLLPLLLLSSARFLCRL